MKKCLLGLMLPMVALSLAEGATSLSDYDNPTNGVSITAGFIPDAQRIIVGEPLFLTFVVSNRAAQPFQFSHVHNEIFTITATNTSGLPARSRPFGFDGNGIESRETLLPGKAYTNRLFVNERYQFEEPGDYILTCRCDFRSIPPPFQQNPNGGNGSNHNYSLGQPVISTLKLTVLPADPARLTEIIETWGHVVETNGSLREAAQALGEINDSRTIPYLADLVTKGPGIDYLAVYALARFTNSRSAADALTSALKIGDEVDNYVPQIAGNALRNFHQSEQAASALIPGLTNSDANVRIQTARAVSWTGSQFAFIPLCSLLLDASNSVRYVAAQAIGRLGDARSFDVLTNLLNDQDYYLRIAAVKGLVALNRPFQADWLMPVIRAARNNESNFRTYHEAIVAMAIYGGKQVGPGLVSCLDFENPSVKDWYNFYLLQYIEDHDGLKYYYKWQHDPNRDGTETELAENRRILSELKEWLEKQKQK